MAIFNFNDGDALGSVISVDTSAVIVRVDDLERLKRLQVNRLVVLQSSKAGQHLIGIVVKITRKPEDRAIMAGAEENLDEPVDPNENNLVRITLIGTLLDWVGEAYNVFRRTLETVPEIAANCFNLEGATLTSFMQVISNVEMDGPKAGGELHPRRRRNCVPERQQAFSTPCCHCWKYRVWQILDDRSALGPDCRATAGKCRVV